MSDRFAPVGCCTDGRSDATVDLVRAHRGAGKWMGNEAVRITG